MNLEGSFSTLELPPGNKNLSFKEYLKLQNCNTTSDIIIQSESSSNLINPNTWTSHDSHASAKITFADDSPPAPAPASINQTQANSSPKFNIIDIDGNTPAPESSPLSEIQQPAEASPDKISNHSLAFLPRTPSPENKSTSPELQPLAQVTQNELNAKSEYQTTLEESVLKADSSGLLVPWCEEGKLVFKSADPFNPEDFHFNNSSILDLIKSPKSCDYHIIHKSDIARFKSELSRNFISAMRALPDFHPDVLEFKAKMYQSLTHDIELFFEDTKPPSPSTSSS